MKNVNKLIKKKTKRRKKSKQFRKKQDKRRKDQAIATQKIKMTDLDVKFVPNDVWPYKVKDYAGFGDKKQMIINFNLVVKKILKLQDLKQEQLLTICKAKGISRMQRFMPFDRKKKNLVKVLTLYLSKTKL